MGEHEPRPVALAVTQQGPVIVNGAHIHREAPGIACIYMDLRSKRAELCGVGGGGRWPPQICLGADDHTLHIDESQPRDELTTVTLPEYVGWRIFACDGPARYTVAIVLIQEPPTAEQWDNAESTS